MRIALVADWLTTLGGAEQTIAEFLGIWPEAPLFTTVARTRAAQALHVKDLRTSRLQPLYRMLRRHQVLLPLLPRAIESFDLRGFDVILSSSHAVAKGIIPPSNAVHVCYCHTPMRYAWEMEEEYLRDARVPAVLRRSAKNILGRLRRWDLSTAKRVDVFIANSGETQRRIERIYGREATVVHPPVHDRFLTHPLENGPREFFLSVGRLVPYKRIDLLIEAANALKLPLVIAGKGQEERRLRSLAGSTVRFLGYVPDADLPDLYAHARALLFAPHEDAGIVPLEAQACGTPVIAYGKGGVLDTVQEGMTGVFFTEQTIASIAEGWKRFAAISWDAQRIRDHAARFSAGRFHEEMQHIVQDSNKKFVMR